MTADPKSASRVRDADIVRAARLAGDECAACGFPPGSVHHVIQKGAPHHGDDDRRNLVLLCGTGTSGCHGAHHGSPYHQVSAPLGGDQTITLRDAAWVNRRLGQHLLTRRPDTISYVIEKLGADPAREFLFRTYEIDISA